MDKQYIDDRIESMLISKIAHYRLEVREIDVIPTKYA